MPFGKYGRKPKGEGLAMQDVPAAYFQYLWNNGMRDEIETKDVANYIYRNLDALKEENPDLIFDPPTKATMPSAEEVEDDDVPF